MPQIRDYPEASTPVATDAYPFDRLGIGTMYIEFSDLVQGIVAESTIYDVSMGYPAVIPGAFTVLSYIAARALTLNGLGSPAMQAALEVAPSGGDLVFSVYHNVTLVGTLTFADGTVSGVWAIAAPVIMAIADRLRFISGGSTHGASGLTLTMPGVLTV